ncbi:hypothetical protein GCM10017673_38120 [Streptosporangium violaceochromogenes]|nr:hypothetical protein GCM10017673_38120 [Streptosporangium violaceochromogenes]
MTAPEQACPVSWGDTLPTFDDALAAFYAYMRVEWDERVQKIGQGEDRCAYLVDGVVYKMGPRATANPYDHATLEAARRAGLPWAPPSELFQLVNKYSGEEWSIMAMPYIQDDGTDPDPDAMARMREETGGQVDFTNYRTIGGQPVVIDGCTVDRGPWYHEA